MSTDTDLPAGYQDMAERSKAAGIADENAELLAKGDAGDGADGAGNSGQSSEEPAEGSEDAAPRQPGSPQG